jgi:hypothetical protein
VGKKYKFDTRYSPSEVLRDSSVRLRNPPIDVKKYQQSLIQRDPNCGKGRRNEKPTIDVIWEPMWSAHKVGASEKTNHTLQNCAQSDVDRLASSCVA